MNHNEASKPVRCWQQQVVIPTYPVQDADPNPMFLEKRVYQGSSGKVYPNPFTDRVALKKEDATYRAIMLENEFIELMILPEIGGRIHSGQDKTNQYDFFYRQHVIKPALVGLLGPWISGGVEFNWPQHHRPSTYMPVHCAVEEEDDGGCTVWLSEHDPMLRMKGMVGVRLSPGKAIVEARVRLFNRTPLPQTFLWWANVAVRVHDQYQAFFPPDVIFVADHARRAVSSFPIARNTYYGVDYGPGTDISWYRNIPVPTSYMVAESKFDFCGGYDHQLQAGLVHTSNHHIAPGKKLWTWGNAEFGYAWDRNLTDEDGPYVELMAGAYTDNQPDFSWLQPYETKTFSQYWYPIQKIGPVQNANTEAAVSLQLHAGVVRVGVCATSRRKVHVSLTCNGDLVFEQQVSLAPGEPFVAEIKGIGDELEEYRLSVRDPAGWELIGYQPQTAGESKLPQAATEPPAPQDIATVEELYLTGLHLEQYRHATRSAQAYWCEGLKRDSENAQLNNAMGRAYLRQGVFAKAEEHLVRAVRRLKLRNSNPYDGEAFYNLGLALRYQGRNEEAFNAFHKAVWNFAWQSAGYFALASISAEREDFSSALQHAEQSLLTNAENLRGRGLKASLLRRMGRATEAQAVIDNALLLDRLDFRIQAEQFLLSRSEKDLNAFLEAIGSDIQTLVDVGFDLAWDGLGQDAFALLQACQREGRIDQPMVYYTLSWLTFLLGENEQSSQYAAAAETASPRYCFPARLEEMIVLEDAIKRNPQGSKAFYYLGNLYYDKRRYEDAISCWQRSVALDGEFSIPWRNLGIAEFNVRHNAQAAGSMYEQAFRVNSNDARLLYEWDQLKKRAALALPEERLRSLRERMELVERRDDLMVEFIALLNQRGRHKEALEILGNRRFNPWEGGEGLVSEQYVYAHKALGKACLGSGCASEALRHFESARRYPENLGEAKHLLTLERDLDYLSGIAAAELGDTGNAKRFWEAAAAPLPSPGVHSFFQAMALKALGQEEACTKVLLNLAEFADLQMKRIPMIDYFATSLPNLLLFDDDLSKRNRLEAQLLRALANHGLGERENACRQLQEISTEEPSHLLAAEMLRWLAADSEIVS